MAILDNRKILLVEDEQLVAEMYVQSLETNGASVMAADSGQKGLELLENNEFDLVILDRILNSDMTGFDVLEEMRSNEHTKDIPVIILTNLNLEPEDEVFIEKHGVSGYYVKAEISLDILSTIFSEIVNRRNESV